MHEADSDDQRPGMPFKYRFHLLCFYRHIGLKCLNKNGFAKFIFPVFFELWSTGKGSQ
jgi:hypothetical protein